MATAPHRSVSMDKLYDNALTVWPGMTIGWIGDLSHQGEISGHNPDDYAPLQAEQVDSDNDPEVRALDFMIGSKFTSSDASDLVDALTTGVDRNRLYYVIYDHTIYKKSNNFQPAPYTGTDPHTNHVHASGLAVDDANSSNWNSVLALGENMTEPWNPNSVAAESWRTKAIAGGDDPITWTRPSDGSPQSEPNVLHQKLAEVLAAIAAIPPSGGGAGPSLDDIRQVVREELDKTTLGS
jgi:hypothetical protein